MGARRVPVLSETPAMILGETPGLVEAPAILVQAPIEPRIAPELLDTGLMVRRAKFGGGGGARRDPADPRGERQRQGEVAGDSAEAAAQRAAIDRRFHDAPPFKGATISCRAS